jgi:hypothetical protein
MANHSPPDEQIVVDKGVAPRWRLHRKKCAKFTPRPQNNAAVESESSGVASRTSMAHLAMRDDLSVLL